MTSLKTFLVLVFATFGCASPITSTLPQENITCSTKFQEVVVKFTVLLAKAEKYDEARREITEIQNYENLTDQVIKNLYDGQKDYAKNCLFLLRNISCPAYANGVASLYKEMKEHNHLTEPEVLVFAEYLEENECLAENLVGETNKALQPHVDNILAKWASDIRNGTYEHIFQPLDWQNDFRSQDGLCTKMRKSTELALARNESNFLATLNFIRNSPEHWLKGTGLLSLVNELIKMGKHFSTEMMQTAKLIHLQTTTENLEELGKCLAEGFVNATELVPSEIRDLFWNGNCVIKNTYYGEYLFAGMGIEDNSTAVFTWIPGSRVLQGDWTLKPHRTEDNNVYFKILNTFYSSPYYVYLDKADNSQSLTTNATQEGTDWELRPTTNWDRERVFVLQNKATKEYLAATSIYNMGTKRRTISGQARARQDGYWKITCE